MKKYVYLFFILVFILPLLFSCAGLQQVIKKPEPARLTLLFTSNTMGALKPSG